ncbi:MAG: helix-turn-helix domain-containing protein [Actinomycetota bacterium]|nr:helix-turn-helix domain-containing protein [Actinomycetota bacterium]MDQ3464099.1 helix-turn-helix domain-containing protein [Actinomycetota bacterium]
MTGEPSTVEPDMPPQRPQPGDATDAAELVLEDRFSMVPEWLLDADIGDCALRLYAVLLRYGNTTGARMPARSTLAARLHKKSVDTVDRALVELVRFGAVQVENRFAGGQRLTNRYRIRTSHPGCVNPAPTPGPAPCDGGGRTNRA